MTIRVLIADDSAITRRGLTWIIESSGDMEVCGEAADGAQAVALAGELGPDVVLLDIRMPNVDGLAALPELLRTPRPPRVIVLATFHEDAQVAEALRTGAVGFLLKDTPPDDLLRAIREVHAGNATLGPAVARRLLDARAGRTTTATPEEQRRLATLSARERDVLRLLARGLTNADIAAELGTTEGTVKGYVSNVLAKLDADSRVRAATLAYRAGLDRD
ncbi:response regulator transcription factor [Streptomyces sp. N35]|uniref:response regulator n=1 Tax=Streptomyces sp. N35 TaxID=2795730 RepID=UPI0018F3D02D|nr:response regulator transcription factor [Streptomyces sp. N35]